MTETTVIALPDDRTTNFDWGAIFGGALLTSVVAMVLLTFGMAAGFGSVSPYSWSNPSATTLTVIGAGWFALVMIGSSLAGGYFTGRFRRRSGSVAADERQARDGAHGLLMWAVSFLIGVILAYLLAQGAAQVAASAAGGAASMTAQGVSSDRVGQIVDVMTRPNPNNPERRIENPRAEVSRVLSSSALTRGTITNDDRDYVARIVAAQGGMSQEEARKRVDAGIEQAKQAADAARKTAAWLAFLIGAVSILAAGAAHWAAGAGGREREENIWR